MLFRFSAFHNCGAAAYLHLIFAAIFAPLIRSFLLSTLTLFLLRFPPLSSFFSHCYCNLLSYLLFSFVAFSFKLALKQFYDTISTQQINSLVTTTDGDPSPFPYSPSSLPSLPPLLDDFVCPSFHSPSQWQRAFFLMRTAFIIRPVARCHCKRNKSTRI